jgi:hypothetical protein
MGSDFVRDKRFCFVRFGDGLPFTFVPFLSPFRYPPLMHAVPYSDSLHRDSLHSGASSKGPAPALRGLSAARSSDVGRGRAAVHCPASALHRPLFEDGAIDRRPGRPGS